MRSDILRITIPVTAALTGRPRFRETIMNENAFCDQLKNAPPSPEEREAYARWLSEQGEEPKASFIRHRASMMHLPAGSELQQFHHDAIEELQKSLSDEWLSLFRADLAPSEKQRLSCYPHWTGALDQSEEDIPSLQIADGLSVYFHSIEIDEPVTRSLLDRWRMPFEYIVSQTVELYSYDLQDWSPLGPERNRVFLRDDSGDDGSWAIWFYAPPAMWDEIEEETDGAVVLTGSPVLFPLDANRLLLTSLDDASGLEQMAHSAKESIGDYRPIVRRPLRHDPRTNWDYLRDEENPAAQTWRSNFGPHDHPPLPRRSLRAPIDVISDPAEREAARELIDRCPAGDRIDVLTLSGQKGDWRKGESQTSRGVPTIPSLPHLQELRVWHAKLSKHWWNTLGDAELPGLISVILEHCRYDGNSAEILASFQSIKVLHLNRLNDAGLEPLHELANLRELKASGTDVSDYGLRQFADHDIEFLDLSHCQNITDASAKTFGTLVNLRGLNLQQTALTNQFVEQLGRLQKLRYIDLRGTAVTDDAVFGLSQIKSLRRIDGISGSAKLTLMDELPHYGTRRT